MAWADRVKKNKEKNKKSNSINDFKEFSSARIEKNKFLEETKNSKNYHRYVYSEKPSDNTSKRAALRDILNELALFSNLELYQLYLIRQNFVGISDKDFVLNLFKLYPLLSNFKSTMRKIKKENYFPKDYDTIETNLSKLNDNQLYFLLDEKPNYYPKTHLVYKVMELIKTDKGSSLKNKSNSYIKENDISKLTTFLYRELYDKPNRSKFIYNKPSNTHEGSKLKSKNSNSKENKNKKSKSSKIVNNNENSNSVKYEKSELKYTEFKGIDISKNSFLINNQDIIDYLKNDLVYEFLSETLIYDMENELKFSSELKRKTDIWGLSFSQIVNIAYNVIYEIIDNDKNDYKNLLSDLIFKFGEYKSNVTELNNFVKGNVSPISSSPMYDYQKPKYYYSPSDISYLREEISLFKKKYFKEFKREKKIVEAFRELKKEEYIKKFGNFEDLDEINVNKKDSEKSVNSNKRVPKTKSDSKDYAKKVSKTKSGINDYTKEFNKFIDENISKIRSLINLSNSDVYISKTLRDEHINECSDIMYELVRWDMSRINKYKLHCTFEELNKFKRIYRDLISYNGLSDNFNNSIKTANEKYIKKELEENRDFFDNILDTPSYRKEDIISLDEHQRRAVVIDEDNTQIIAGAGTGKTLTLQAKIKYLTKVKKVDESKILCLSYSRVAVDDLIEKVENTIGENQVDIKTFHGLGYDILNINDQSNRVYKGGLTTNIENYFKENIIDDKNKIKKFIQFFSEYFYVPFELNKDVSLGDKYEYERSMDLHTIKGTVNNYNAKVKEKVDNHKSKYKDGNFKELRNEFGHGNEKITTKRERVRSLEELIIADYLFLHGIEYEYERQFIRENPHYENAKETFKNIVFEWTDCFPEELKNEMVEIFDENLRYYKYNFYPDFYLPEYDIYLEHFGVNKNCEAPWLRKKESKRYSKSIQWKRQLCKEHNVKLIETYSYYSNENRLLKRLEEKLKDENVKFKEEIDYENIFKALTSNEQLTKYKNFIDLIESFINLFKGNGYNIDESGNDYSREKFKEFNQKNRKEKNAFKRKRQGQFLMFVIDIYLYYEKNKKNKIDFNDMINDAIKTIKKNGYYKDYDYILVDEYQDTSFTRYNLIRTLKEKSNTKLVVVGDDWQSIYKFTGCNIKLFTEFGEYFPNPEIVKIEKTYRNSQSLLNASGNFIKQNKSQIDKTLISDIRSIRPIKLSYYENNEEKVLILEDIIKGIGEGSEILLLGRNKKDIDIILANDLFYKKGSLDDDGYLKIVYEDNENIDIKFRTIHKSKGLEADYVILLNLEDNMAGFPNKIKYDEIIEYFFMESNEKIPFAEERRLFYVGLTRTRNDVHLLIPNTKYSEFVKELENDDFYGTYIQHLDYEFTEEDLKRLNMDSYRGIATQTLKVPCPICKKGNVQLVTDYNVSKYKNNEPVRFFSCSNHQSCDWRGGSYYGDMEDLKYIDICPICSAVRVVKYSPKNKDYFLGCIMHKRNNCRGRSLSKAAKKEIWDRKSKSNKFKR